MPATALEFVKEIRERLLERPDQIRSAQKQGQKLVGYFCCYVPEEIISAASMIPARIIKYGRSNLQNAGSSYLCSNSCPLVNVTVGLKKWNRDFYFKQLDYLADAPSCQQMHRALEVWEHYFSVKILQIGFPRNYYREEGLHYFTESLTLFKETLEEYSGSLITAAALETAVACTNEIRCHLRWLYDSLKTTTPVLAWQDLLEIMQAGFLLDRETFRDFLSRIRNSLAPLPQPLGKQVRILLTGGTLAPGDLLVPQLLHALGATVVMDETCCGSRGAFGAITEPTIAGIAKRYLHNIPCDALAYPHTEGDTRQENLEQLMQEYQVDGVIYYSLRFCDGRSFKEKDIRATVKQAGIPFLHLISSYSDSDKGQMTTRIEAFLENL